MRKMIEDGYPVATEWSYYEGAQAGALILGKIAEGYNGEGVSLMNKSPYVHWTCLNCGAKSTDTGQHPKRLDRIEIGALGGRVYETGKFDAGVRSCGCKQKNNFKEANILGTKVSKHQDFTYGGIKILLETEYVDANRSKIIMGECPKCLKPFPTTRRHAAKSCGCISGRPYSGNLDDYREGHKLKSKGEKHIAKLLDGFKIKYETEKKFSNCLGDGNFAALPFDFYLESFDKKLIIEVDGDQHFKPAGLYGGEEGFQKRRRYDLKKDKYCFDNNINLIRIPYSQVFQLDKNNFFTMLKKFLITQKNEDAYYKGEINYD